MAKNHNHSDSVPALQFVNSWNCWLPKRLFDYHRNWSVCFYADKEREWNLSTNELRFPKFSSEPRHAATSASHCWVCLHSFASLCLMITIGAYAWGSNYSADENLIFFSDRWSSRIHCFSIVGIVNVLNWIHCRWFSRSFSCFRSPYEPAYNNTIRCSFPALEGRSWMDWADASETSDNLSFDSLDSNVGQTSLQVWTIVSCGGSMLLCWW